MKRKIAIFIIAIMIVSSFSTFSVSAKRKMKINYSKKSVFLGKTAKLKIKNTKKKVKWSTNNKTVVSVSKKGRIKGLKIGKATITAKVGKKKFKCKVSVYGYTIAECEISYMHTPGKPEEGTHFVSFVIRKKGKEVTPSGNVDIIYMNSSKKTVFTDTIPFSSKDYDWIGYGDGPMIQRCEIPFDMNKKPSSLMGTGYLAFRVRLNNGQVFYYIEPYGRMFSNSAKSGETIKVGNATVKVPYFTTCNTYSSNVKIASILLNEFEYSIVNNGNNKYTLVFSIAGKKSWDMLGNNSTVECWLSFGVIKDNSIQVPIKYYGTSADEQYRIYESFSNRKVGDRVGTYSYSIDITEGEYEIVMYDFKH